MEKVEFGEVLAAMMVCDTFSLHIQHSHVCKNMVLSSSKLNNVNISAEIHLKEEVLISKLWFKIQLSDEFMLQEGITDTVFCLWKVKCIREGFFPLKRSVCLTKLR